MRYLNTLYVTGHRSTVRRSKGSLVTTGESGTQRIPLEAIDAVVLLGGGHMTTDAIASCAERGIRVAALRRGGSVRFTVGGPRGGNVHLRMAQYRAATDTARSLDIARLIVAAKLQSSRRVLLRWARDSPQPQRSSLERRADMVADRLEVVARSPDANHLRGLEGDAARTYFRGMGQALSDTSFRFTDRNRRPLRDPVNALLGFAYGLMLAEVTGAVEAVGLDHQIGFFHRARSGRASLALDVVEEMRSLVDLLGALPAEATARPRSLRAGHRGLHLPGRRRTRHVPPLVGSRQGRAGAPRAVGP